MLLSQFTGAVVGAGIATGQHLRGRQLKRQGKKMSRALKEGAASGAITGAGLSAARAKMLGLGGKTGVIGTALGSAVGAGLGAGHTAIGYKMAKKKKGFR